MKTGPHTCEYGEIREKFQMKNLLNQGMAVQQAIKRHKWTCTKIETDLLSRATQAFRGRCGRNPIPRTVNAYKQKNIELGKFLSKLQ